MGLAFLFPAHVKGGLDADDPAETADVCQRNERSDYVINPSRLLGYAQSLLIGRIDVVVLCR